MFITRWLCRHTWEKLHHELIPSNVAAARIRRAIRMSDDQLSQTSITICCCTKCGKLDKTIVRT